MSIYIKGMEMPKSCPCELIGIGYDLCCSFAWGIPARVKEYYECCQNDTMPSWCPLGPVPDHGPLVDWNTVVEKLNETFSWLERDEETGMIHRVYHPLLDMHPIRVPVIIPASKEETE